MNVNDDRIKKLTEALTDKKKKKILELPWRHGVADSLRATAKFSANQTEDFACISRINKKEYVTMPFNLYLTLLQKYDIAQSLDEEQ
jgi:hypothetical protein